MALKCPKCRAVNPDNARFCWNDGEKLVTTGFQLKSRKAWRACDWLINQANLGETDAYINVLS